MVEFDLKAEPVGVQNGRMRFAAEAVATDDQRLLHSDRIDLSSATSRTRFAGALAKKVTAKDDDPATVLTLIEERLLQSKRKADEEAVEVEATKPKSLIAPNVAVLGCDPAGVVYLFSRDTRRLWEFARLRDLDRPTYVLIGGDWVKKYVSEHDQGGVRDEIALTAQ